MVSNAITRRGFLRLLTGAGKGAPSIRWEAAALDEATFAALRARECCGDRFIVEEYRRLMEAAYAEGGCIERARADGINAAFAAHLGFAELIEGAVSEWPLLRAQAPAVFVQGAASAKAEEANLRESGGTLAIVLSLRPARFADLADLLCWLRHEFGHLEDLLDPGFGWDRGFTWPGPTRAEMEIQRRRYRALWCLSVDARLKSAEKCSLEALAARSEAFRTAFSRLPARIVEACLAAMGAWRPTHGGLLAAALDPRALAKIPGQSLTPREEASLAGVARVTCPLCSFPATVWSDPQSWTSGMIEMVKRTFASWEPADGACERCFECYEIRMAV